MIAVNNDKSRSGQPTRDLQDVHTQRRPQWNRIIISESPRRAQDSAVKCFVFESKGIDAQLHKLYVIHRGLA